MKALQTILALSVLAFGIEGAHAQYGFLSKERSGVEFSESDRQMVAQSIRSVLDAGQVGGADAWRNPDSGLSGETRLVETYSEGGVPCGRVDLQIRRRDKVMPFNLRFCRRSDGTWGIAG
jgi:surface antigen